MGSNTFAFSPLPHVFTIPIIFSLLSIANTALACNNTTNPSYNHHTKTVHENTTTNIPSNHYTKTYINYIKTSCSSTTYPSTCYRSLHPYALKIEANPLKLCNVSLSLALSSAYRATNTVSKLLKHNDDLAHTTEQVVEDCFENLKESIGELQDSLAAMGNLNGFDKGFQVSNIKTWVSAAMTDGQTCSDEENYMDGAVRDKIRKNVLKVLRITSNALYFINNLNY
ncbi:21 kDa protein-like [Lotus japonicus]|uniref:21 kDa protein-like n=1 Tax=Lotus japonicus TaxID=34305 RepID=UPI002588A1AB|nr:21 kDa protein-like [Lotus japonicus]